MKQLPLKVNWCITSKCDNWNKEDGYRCLFCYTPETTKELEEHELDKIVNKLIIRGTKIVVITGGEPLLVKNLPYLIKRLTNKSIIVNLSTNGNLLRNRFPDYYQWLSVLSLPLDGPDQITHNKMRNMDDDNFKEVINILDEIKNNGYDKKYGIKIKIVTVLGRSNYTDPNLINMAKLLSNYPITVWKIFEYDRYEDRASFNKWINANQDIVFKKNYIEQLVKPHFLVGEVISYTDDDRSLKYFMINPEGKVIIPTLIKSKGRKRGYYIDRPVGNFLKDIDSCITNWFKYVDIEKYETSISEMYEEIYELLIDRKQYDGLLLKQPYEVQLWQQIKKCGISMVFKGENDFSNFQYPDNITRKNIFHYLQTAEKEVKIIAHSFTGRVEDEIYPFFDQMFKKNQSFSLKIALPNPNCRVVEYLAKSRKFKIDESKNLVQDLKRKIEETKNNLLEVKKNLIKRYGDAALNLIKVYYVDIIPYFSIVSIDDYKIQIETKFHKIEEGNNLIFEITKNRHSDYFNDLDKSIKDIFANYAEEQSIVKLGIKDLIPKLYKEKNWKYFWGLLLISIFFIWFSPFFPKLLNLDAQNHSIILKLAFQLFLTFIFIILPIRKHWRIWLPLAAGFLLAFFNLI